LKDLENGWYILLKVLAKIKENNEKILKRFQFDLEMEVYEDNSGLASISKPVYIFRFRDRKDRRVFTKIMKKLNYKLVFPQRVRSIINASYRSLGITIFPKIKEFGYFYFYLNEEKLYEFNKIPEYISEYKTLF